MIYITKIFLLQKKYEEQRVAVFIKGMKKRCIFLFLGESMHAHVFFVRKKSKKIDKIYSKINGLNALSLEDGFTAKQVREKLSGLLTKTRPIFILDDEVNMSDLNVFIEDLKKEYLYHVKEMGLVNRVHFRPCMQHIWQKTVLVISFKSIKKIHLQEPKKPEVQLI